MLSSESGRGMRDIGIQKRRIMQTENEESAISKLVHTFRESLVAQDIGRHMSLYSEDYGGVRGTKEHLKEFFDRSTSSGAPDDLDCLIDRTRVAINGDGTATVTNVIVGFDDLELTLAGGDGTWLIIRLESSPVTTVAEAQWALESYYKHRFPTNLTVSDVVHVQKGSGNVKYSFRLEYLNMGKRHEEELFLRLSNQHQSKRREYQALDKLGHTAVPAPKVHCIGEGIGASFLIMDKVEGVSIGDAWDGMAEAERERAWELFVTTLADIHRLDWREAGLGVLGLWEGEHGFADLMLFALKPWAEAISSMPASTSSLRNFGAVYAWLEDHKPSTEHNVLLHADYHLENVLIHQGKIAAIVDWEGVGIGDPSYDLCLMLLSSMANGSSDGFGERLLEDYRRTTGRELRNLEYCLTLRAVFLLPFFLTGSHIEPGLRSSILKTCRQVIGTHTGVDLQIQYVDS